MPFAYSADDSFLFVRLSAICRETVVTCDPGTSFIDLARLMKSGNTTGVVVMENGIPTGICSIRDVLSVVARSDGGISKIKVRDCMHTGLITIRDQDCVFDAIVKMARHNIHRLAVVDANGELIGMICDTDLLKLQTRTTLYLNNEIEAAQSLDELRNISGKMLETLNLANKSGADIKVLISLISHFYDAQTRRLIEILEKNEGISLPEGAAYLALGSEGRQEQTLRTDQDSAIIYDDNLPSEKIAEVRRFAERISSALEFVGVPLCPGNMMASNPDWCHSLDEWKQRLNRWITRPDPEATVYFGVFQDLRVLHGRISFEDELRNHICETIRKHSLFLPNMARNIVRFKPPIGMFGRLIVEKKGEHRGKLDLKKGGLFALTRGVGLIALEAGIMGGTTWDKLERLNNLHLVSDHDLEVIGDALTYLIKLRLEKQLIALSSGREPGNSVDPLVLSDMARDQLRASLRGVESLLHILKSRYQLDMIAR